MAVAPYFPEQELKRLGFSGPAITAFRSLLQIAALINGQDTLDSDLTDTALLAVLTEARVDDLETFEADGPYVKEDQTPAWVDPSGTLSRATFAAYAGQVVSNPPLQAEVQAIDDQVKALSQRLAALVTDLRANNTLT